MRAANEALPPLELGHPRTELRRTLVEAVLRGDKTATAGLATDHAPHTDEPLPKSGDRWRLLGYDDEPLAVVGTTEVRLVPAGQIDLQFARDEGEGFESVADWRSAHERFWSDREITDDTLIVAELQAGSADHAKPLVSPRPQNGPADDCASQPPDVCGAGNCGSVPISEEETHGP